MKLLIQNGMIVSENSISQEDIYVVGEKIEAIGEHLEVDDDTKVIDAKGKLVFPGIIDAHVHFKMQAGAVQTADDFVTGSIAALHGGVTSIIDFAPFKNNSFIEGFTERNKDVVGNSYVDYTYHMEVDSTTKVNKQLFEQLKELEVKSIKVYTTYGSDKISDDQIEPLLKLAKQFGIVVMVHAEDDDILQKQRQYLIENDEDDIRNHGKSRPRSAEIEMISYFVELSKTIGNELYIAHVSTKEGAKIIEEAKKTHPNIHGETCPHYLLLDEGVYQTNECKRYIMSPPLRSKEDSKYLKQAIHKNGLSVLSTDHCAFHLADRNNSKFSQTLSGIPGVESLLPLLFTEYYSMGYLSLIDMISALSATPAKLFGIYPQKGTISIQGDADIVIYDPDGETVLKDEDVHSASKYSVYSGRTIQGRVHTTILRGEIMVENGEFVGTQKGRYIKTVSL